MSLALKIQPLTADNYRSWKAQVKGLLMGQEAWGHIVGDDVKPTPAENAANAAAVSAWVKRDRKAMSHILIALESELAAVYDDLDTAQEMWQRITET